MEPSIALLTVGDELINGEMSDTNTATIARILASKGLRVRESVTVGDILSDIAQALEGLTSRWDFIIVTGGLGPTKDDITAEAAALAFNRPLKQNEEAMEQIGAFFRNRSTEMHPANRKQALLPEGVRILQNHRGTAPGFCIEQGETQLYFLPGVPSEMKTMFKASVLPSLLEGTCLLHPLSERILKIFGVSEPRVEELISEIDLPPGVQIAFGVDYPMVHLKLRAQGEDAEELLSEAEAFAKKKFEDAVVATGEESLTEVVARLLKDQSLTLSLAESCTGGLVAKMLTDIPGSSSFLQRGAVTYSNHAKSDWLKVPSRIFEQDGAVSEACARAMAEGILQSSSTDWAIAITGIAGPDGGTEEKPVGTVYIALASSKETEVKPYRFRGNRQRVRELSANTALNELRRKIMPRC